MSKVTLGQILQYLNIEEGCGLIQIVMNDHDWDDAHEVSVDCELLEPFYGYIVTDLSSELSYMDGTPLIRVGIERDNIKPIRKVEELENISGLSEGQGSRECA